MNSNFSKILIGAMLLSLSAAATDPHTIQSSLSLESVQSLHQSEDPNKIIANQINLSLSRPLTDNLLVDSTLGISQGTSEGGSTLLSDLPVRLTLTPRELGGNWAWRPGVEAVLPTSESSRDDQKLNFALGTRQAMTYTRSVFDKPVQFVVTPSFKKNFHEYTLDATSSPNMEYILALSTTAILEFNSDLTLYTSYAAIKGFTYRSFERELYQFILGGTHGLTKQLSATLSLATGGAALQPNGVTSNIKFFNENESTVSGGLTYVF